MNRNEKQPLVPDTGDERLWADCYQNDAFHDGKMGFTRRKGIEIEGEPVIAAE